MKASVAMLTLLMSAPVGAEVQVVDNDTSIKIDCAKDKEVTLVGNKLAVTLIGTCTRVNVTGNHETVTGSAGTFFIAGSHNTVTADRTDEITMSGSHNKVSWKTGSPKVSNTGRENTVGR